MKKSILLIVLICCCSLLFGQSAIGKWTTIDDATNKKKSIVELYKKDDKLFGKITYLYPRDGRVPNPKCDLCTDDRKDKPLVGLQIVRSLEWDGSVWKGGTIVDPENGKVYTVKIWTDKKTPDKLNVRGYVGPFFRTQIWEKVKD